MLHDARGVGLKTENAGAAAALEAATLSLLGHRADLALHLGRALSADPGLVPAQALAGLGALIAVRQEMEPQAARHLTDARAALLARGGSARDRGLVAALSAWAEHADMAGAAEHLGHLVRANPRDAMAIKLEHAIRFMLGDSAGMRASLEAAAPAWSHDLPGRGYLLGLRAFALEETGETGLAERLGREAVAEEPADLWGGHAVAHVFEGDGRAREGIAWIDGLARHIAEGGGFGRHLMWHAALFHLHLGDHEAALALLDQRIHDQPAEDARDFANAASLLWRLEAQGVGVGRARWDRLADIAARRAPERGLAFIDLHHVLALGAAGRREELAAKLAAMRHRAGDIADAQFHVLDDCGLPAAEGLALAMQGRPGAAVDLLLPLRGRMQALGGSIAQRDVFERVLIQACLDSGRIGLAAGLLDDRAGRRALGAWEGQCLALLEREAA